jgi:hypothetical protein
MGSVMVRRAERHCRFEVLLVSPDGGGTHCKTFEVSNKQVSSFDRIGR